MPPAHPETTAPLRRNCFRGLSPLPLNHMGRHSELHNPSQTECPIAVDHDIKTDDHHERSPMITIIMMAVMIETNQTCPRDDPRRIPVYTVQRIPCLPISATGAVPSCMQIHHMTLCKLFEAATPSPPRLLDASLAFHTSPHPLGRNLCFANNVDHSQRKKPKASTCNR